MALVLDTGPLYASLDRDDEAHESSRRLIETSRERLVIPAPVLVEVDHLLRRSRRGDLMGDLLGDVASGAYEVLDLDAFDYPRVRELCQRYADSDIGFVDAAVLATVERLSETKLATLDHRHFSILRLRHVSALTLLPA